MSCLTQYLGACPRIVTAFTVFFYLNESGVHFYAVESISVGSHLYYRFLVDEGERYRAGIYGVLDRTVFVVTQ